MDERPVTLQPTCQYIANCNKFLQIFKHLSGENSLDPNIYGEALKVEAAGRTTYFSIVRNATVAAININRLLVIISYTLQTESKNIQVR